MFKPLHSLTIACLLCCLAAPARGETEPPPAPAVEAGEEVPATEEELPALPPVTVVGQPEDVLTGSDRLDRSLLDHLPAKNGSLNEALGVLPGVQLPEQARTSETAGEITPPNLSISGGRFYENNFLIDGIGNNSLLDPVFTDPSNISNTPGHPQALFLNPSLIEQTTIYRSNISSRYGGFTGGVVETETRNPAKEFGGQLSLRTTRSAWTEMHIDDSKYSDFHYSISEEYQPEFEKYDGSLSLDLPLGPTQGLLVSYSRLWSDLELYSLGQKEDQKRLSENYFLKYVNELTAQTSLTLSGLYAPYTGDYFLKDARDSDYTLEGGGYSLAAKLDHSLDIGDLRLKLAWAESENSREAPNGYFIWNITPAKPWGALASKPFSYEGGYGDLDKEQQTLTLGADLTFEPVHQGELTHLFAAGLLYEDVQASFDRPETLTRYTGAVSTTAVECLPGEIDCIQNQQFMYFKTIYPADSAETRIRFSDAYLEDEMLWGRFSFRPGVRVSYNDLMQNTDIAPRLAAGVDLLGDGQTLLKAGYNRYYGKTFLAYALEEEKAPSISVRRVRGTGIRYFDEVTNRPEPWDTPSVSTLAKRLTDLDTPYSDEYTVGIDQALLAGRLNLWYIKRLNRDELASRQVVLDKRYTEWTNEGETDHDEVGVSWERNWSRHSLLVNATWQETSTSNLTYIDRTEQLDRDGDGTDDPVVYDGKVVLRSELPRTDFNRPWVGNLVYIGRFSHGLSFTNVVKYRSGYRALEDTKINLTVPGYAKALDVYAEKQMPESWVFDWRLDWEKALARKQAVIVSLEINNVFDEKVPSGENYDIYDLGRQFWLGLTYKF